MRELLKNKNTCFYRIIPARGWESTVSREGLIPKDGRIFVTRTNDTRVLTSIALTQLSDTYKDNRVAILRLPQKLNDFKAEEITIDFQSNEPTMPVQNIILRTFIPPEHIILESIIEIDLIQANINLLKEEHEYLNEEEYLKSFNLVYEDGSKCFRLTGIQKQEFIECRER